LTRVTRDAALDALRAGGVVLLTTDTLPGLHALATAPGAAGRIAAEKGHPPDRPYLLLLDSVEAAFQLGEPCDPADAARLRELWPAPLTALLRPLEGVEPEWTAGGQSIGVRVPDAPGLLELIRELGAPIFSTSANLAGEAPAEDLEEAQSRFPGLPALDTGDVPRPGPSTIVDFTTRPPRLVRTGLQAFDLDSGPRRAP